MRYRYAVKFQILVQRTDNQMLTDAENAMVEEMQRATEKVIADIMAKHGNGNQQIIGRDKTVF